jgi:hypothetical protein
MGAPPDINEARSSDLASGVGCVRLFNQTSLVRQFEEHYE